MHFRQGIRKIVNNICQKTQWLNPFTWKEKWITSTPKDFVGRQVQIWNMVSPKIPIFDMGNVAENQPAKISYVKESSIFVRLGSVVYLATCAGNMLHLAWKFRKEQNGGTAKLGSYVLQNLIWLCFGSCTIMNKVLLDKHQDIVRVLNMLCGDQNAIGLGIWITKPLKLVMLNLVACIFGASALFSINLLFQDWENMSVCRWLAFLWTVVQIVRQNTLGSLTVQVMIPSYIAIARMSDNLLEMCNSPDVSGEQQIQLYRRLQIVANEINACVGGLLSMYITTGVTSIAIMMGTVVVSGNLRESAHPIEVTLAGFLGIQMLVFIAVGFWFPARCHQNSIKILEGWKRNRMIYGRNKILRRMARSCKEIRLNVGNGYFMQGTVLKVINFVADTTASMALVISGETDNA